MNVRNTKGFTLIELLIVVAIIGIIAAIAIPGLMRARMSGNEASAIGSMRAINSGEATYSASAAGGGYATLLATLAIPCNDVGSAFLSEDLTQGTASANGGVLKSGYGVVLQASTVNAAGGPPDCNGTPTSLAYYAFAEPESPGVTGTRAFATNQVGTVWQDTTGARPAEPFTMNAPQTTPIQ